MIPLINASLLLVFLFELVLLTTYTTIGNPHISLPHQWYLYIGLAVPFIWIAHDIITYSLQTRISPVLIIIDIVFGVLVTISVVIYTRQ